jgi:hypothetical protein
MATTLRTLAKYLDRRNWKYRIEEDASQIITGVQAQNVEEFTIVLKLTENGEFLQLIVPGLLAVKDCIYKGVIFQTMLAISYQVKMLRFEYDPEDGEVRASIELPLEDAPLTERQFNRCLNWLFYLVDETTMPRLKAVLATGEDPGDEQVSKQAAKNLLDRLPDDFIEFMAQEIAKRQRRLRNCD